MSASHQFSTPTMKRYIFITANLCTARDWERFGLEWFNGLGYESIALECVDLIHPDKRASLQSINNASDPRSISVSDLNELEGFIVGIRPTDIVVLSCWRTAFPALFTLLHRHKVTYCTLSLSPYPRFHRYSARMGVGFCLRALLGDLASALYLGKQYLLSLWQDLRSGATDIAPSYHLSASKRPNVNFFIEFPFCTKTRHISTISQDGMEVNRKGGISNDITNAPDRIVFLDSGLTMHPDIPLAYDGCPLSDHYIEHLGWAFDWLEKKYRCSVVVAGHPRIDYAACGNQFIGREVIYGRTAELVKGAKLVICTVSTAVAFAAVYRRPVIFFTTDELDLWHTIQADLTRLSSWFGQAPINLDRETPPANLPKVDERRYQAYEEAFVRPFHRPLEHQLQPLIESLGFTLNKSRKSLPRKY